MEQKLIFCSTFQSIFLCIEGHFYFCSLYNVKVEWWSFATSHSCKDAWKRIQTCKHNREMERVHNIINWNNTFTYRVAIFINITIFAELVLNLPVCNIILYIYIIMWIVKLSYDEFNLCRSIKNFIFLKIVYPATKSGILYYNFKCWWKRSECACTLCVRGRT